MLSRDPKTLAFVLIIAGLGLCAWFGEQWYRLPEWSEAEIQQSVDLNLTMDVQRMGPQLAPTGEKLEQLRGIVRAEVEGAIKREREMPLRWVADGLMLIVAGLSNLLFARLAAKRTKA
jgi:hypothetical protein